MTVKKAKEGEGGMSAIGSGEPTYFEYSKPPSSVSNFEGFRPPSPGITKMADKPPELGDPYSASSVASLSRTAVPTGQISTSTTSFAGSPPVYPEMPEFVAPEWDVSKVRSEARKISAPGISKLRQAVQMAMSAPYRNPNVRRMTLRDALSGYGEGLGSIATAAERQAIAEYGQQYQIEAGEAAQNWQALQTQRTNEFNAALSSYLAGRTTTVATEKQYPEAVQGYLGIG